MTKLPTIRVLAAAITAAAILIGVATPDVYAATRDRLSQVTSPSSAGPDLRPHWPPRAPCRNWHKICNPF